MLSFRTVWFLKRVVDFKQVENWTSPLQPHGSLERPLAAKSRIYRPGTADLSRVRTIGLGC